MNFSELPPIVELTPPEGERRLVLHACCAPCSSAILEALLANGLEPTLLFCNPNIAPEEEYEKRKGELVRHVERLGVPFFDGDDDHEEWLRKTEQYREEPERGKRCPLCFEIRLERTAQFAAERGIRVITTTLGSSRWKRIEQIEAAGRKAVAPYPGMIFWEQNWRKLGIADRRDRLVKEFAFYNQEYCGCEKSLAGAELRRQRQAAKKEEA